MQAAPGRGQLIGVCAARGGDGASVTALNIAANLARGRLPAVVVDLDPAGGALDVLCGLEDHPGVRWPGLQDVDAQVPGDDLLALLPQWGQVSVLSSDRTPGHRLAPGSADAVVAALRQVAHVVLDFARCALIEPREEADLWHQCESRLVVLRPDLHSIARAQTIPRGGSGRLGDFGGAGGLGDLGGAVGAGGASAPPTFLLRASRRTGLSPAQISSALGAAVLRIPSDNSMPAALARGIGPHSPALAKALRLGLPEIFFP